MPNIAPTENYDAATPVIVDPVCGNLDSLSRVKEFANQTLCKNLHTVIETAFGADPQNLSNAAERREIG